MVRRTKGYILLTLLVLTGLASQQYRETISYKERQAVLTRLRQNKVALVQGVESIPSKQWSSSPGATAMARLYTVETNLLYFLEQNSGISGSGTTGGKPDAVLNTSLAEGGLRSWSSPEAAIKDWKILHQQIVKLARSTTEDLHARRYTIDGISYDGYDLFLLAARAEEQVLEELTE
jgi:hypothetical protein